MVRPFPRPGPSLRLAYRELQLASDGDNVARRELGDLTRLPRPWIPTSLRRPQQRLELWSWLEAAAIWINHELVFDPADAIPACWPEHAHLVHELAVLVDQRYRCELALNSSPLEEWHRYALPAFLDRMRHRVGTHCEDGHAGRWPAAARFRTHLDDAHSTQRAAAFNDEAEALQGSISDTPSSPRRLRLIDEETGEIT
ncbi:hypothetical protein [Aeromicrobium piscarium]|uniref:Uncharacterized protein n=1 Tax=Aeromicrobium piscarium TaxID=2590901 RepID=A0A554RMF3_9ACTN|nr:hypothetical protein [Aeromicrobium piscarium]TSD55290.1 hypothetical protein FNM00_17160 [Aeromicrobium piscarium]